MELGIMTKPNYNKKKFQDLKETIELKAVRYFGHE